VTEKIVVDATDLTLGEMAEIADVITPQENATDGSNFRYTAALAWMVKRRTDPDFTYEDALKLRMGDLEVVNHDPEALAAGNGGKPLSSPVLGPSTLVT
jgi:hypothetical protein